MIAARIVLKMILAASSLIAGQAVSAATPSPAEGNWILQAVGDIDATSLGADMQMNGSLLMGSDGCNRISMPYSEGKAGSSTIRFSAGHGVTTLMACPGLEDKVSRAFAAGIAEVRSYRVAGARLEFLDASGKVRLVYQRQPVEIADALWMPIGLNIGNGVESSDRVSGVRLRLDSNGQAQVMTGCKTLYLNYQYSRDGKITFNVRKLGRKVRCNMKGDIAIVHKAMFLALSHIRTWTRVADRLELRSADGAMQYHARELRGAP